MSSDRKRSPTTTSEGPSARRSCRIATIESIRASQNTVPLSEAPEPFVLPKELTSNPTVVQNLHSNAEVTHQLAGSLPTPAPSTSLSEESSAVGESTSRLLSNLVQKVVDNALATANSRIPGVHHLPSHPRRRVEDFRGNDFAQSLFDSKFSAKVCRAVLNTLFFEKIIANTLAPEEYGRYMVQHVAWVYNAASVFDFAAEEMQGQSPPDFPLYYRRWSRDYATDSSVFKSEWNLRNTTALDTGPAAATYLAYQKHLSQFDPEYLVIGFLPCDMLRSWVANKINDQVPETHVYRSWVDQNLRDGSSKTQTLVNKYFSKDDDWKYCQDIFNEGMINELNFFRSVCGEELVDYVFGD